jgi:predicted nucleotidyltransferase
MSRKNPTAAKAKPRRWYRGSKVPLSVIRHFAKEVAERFRPEKIILFGSHAYGSPHADSDVDILVVMPARNQIDQAVRIDREIDPPFPLDLIVRTPKALAWRLQEGDWFLREIVSKGKILYEKTHQGVGACGKEHAEFSASNDAATLTSSARCRHTSPARRRTRDARGENSAASAPSGFRRGNKQGGPARP